jgi:hypothetical protein
MTDAGRNRQDGEVVNSAMTTGRRPWMFIAILILTLTGCAGATGVPSPSVAPGTGLSITAMAGPTCPVETLDDPCPPRPVAGATVIILDGQGTSVATVVLDAQGSAVVAIGTGDYVVQPQPAEGLMGTAESVNVTVVGGALTPVVLSYDTGIR